MTFPGADTMKGGIIGDDCFLFKAGATCFVEGTTEGILEVNWARVVSIDGFSGECSGI